MRVGGYYVSKYSGEEMDRLLDRMVAGDGEGGIGVIWADVAFQNSAGEGIQPSNLSPKLPLLFDGQVLRILGDCGFAFYSSRAVIAKLLISLPESCGVQFAAAAASGQYLPAVVTQYSSSGAVSAPYLLPILTTPGRTLTITLGSGSGIGMDELRILGGFLGQAEVAL